MGTDNDTKQGRFRLILGPIFMMTFIPVFALTICAGCLRGSLAAVFHDFSRSSNDSGSSLVEFSTAVGIAQGLGSPTAWTIFVAFVASQLIVLRCVPGCEEEGVAATGRTPVYKTNGLASFFLTTAGYVLLSIVFGLFPATILYDNLLEILWVAEIASIVLCLWLAVRKTSNTLTGTRTESANEQMSLLLKFYWGREVHPRVMGFELKQVTNCRFGMMIWPLIVISCMAKQWEIYGYISNSMATAAFLQFAYLTKFFHWESGYMRTLDMMHDRAGYYICWGCMFYVPSIYPSPAMYLVRNPNSLPTLVAAALIASGLLCIGLNYQADWQKQEVRKSDGRCLIWGEPPKMIRAKYTDENKVEHSQILLVSGWWGISKHFHYIPEILTSLIWTLPCLFESGLPYFYVIYLTMLLVDRTNRDDRRCLNKYKSYWKKYTEAVPYKMIPYIY